VCLFSLSKRLKNLVAIHEIPRSGTAIFLPLLSCRQMKRLEPVLKNTFETSNTNVDIAQVGEEKV
jgi:hypothetical protein